MLFHVITAVMTAASLVGVVMNIYKMQACFYIWAVTNAGWCIVGFYKGIYAQSFLFFVYFLLAIWGIYKWRPDAES